MRPEQVDLIRKSFDAMWPIRRDIADLCYSRFFELAPDARDLFAGDMERQRVKLMDMIAALVSWSTSSWWITATSPFRRRGYATISTIASPLALRNAITTSPVGM
jgi:hypothetical protein